MKTNDRNLLTNLEGSILVFFVGCLNGRLYGCHAGDSSDVTLAFEDAQVMPPFSREETDNTDNTAQMIQMTQMILMMQIIQTIQMIQMIQNRLDTGDQY